MLITTKTTYRITLQDAEFTIARLVASLRILRNRSDGAVNTPYNRMYFENVLKIRSKQAMQTFAFQRNI